MPRVWVALSGQQAPAQGVGCGQGMPVGFGQGAAAAMGSSRPLNFSLWEGGGGRSFYLLISKILLTNNVMEVVRAGFIFLIYFSKALFF